MSISDDDSDDSDDSVMPILHKLHTLGYVRGRNWVPKDTRETSQLEEYLLLPPLNTSL